MGRLGLIAATALPFILATPAMAQDNYGTAHRPTRSAVRGTTPAGDPNLPVENALRWGYSQGYSNYPSGFGGLYGDGRYPGNTVTDPRYNTLR